MSILFFVRAAWATNIKADHGPEKIDLEAFTLGHVSTETKILELAPYEISVRPICIGGECAWSAEGSPCGIRLSATPLAFGGRSLCLCLFVGTIPTVLLSDDMDATPAALPISRRGQEKSSARPAGGASASPLTSVRAASASTAAGREPGPPSKLIGADGRSDQRQDRSRQRPRDLALDTMGEFARAGLGEIHAVIGPLLVGGFFIIAVTIPQHNPLSDVRPTRFRHLDLYPPRR
jgi:hypothetical protein